MKAYTIEIKWALIFVLMSFVWMLLEKLTGLHSTHIDQHAIYTNLVAIPAIAIYIFALRDKRKNFYEGKMSYKQGFISGLIISCIIALISPFTQFVVSTIITPEYFPNVIAYAVESGKMNQAEAEAYLIYEAT